MNKFENIANNINLVIEESKKTYINDQFFCYAYNMFRGIKNIGKKEIRTYKIDESYRNYNSDFSHSKIIIIQNQLLKCFYLMIFI